MQMIKISCIMGRTHAVAKWIYDQIYQSKLRSTQTIPLSNKHFFRAHKKRTQAVTWGSQVPFLKWLLSILARHLFRAVFYSQRGHLATFAQLCGPLSSILWIRGQEGKHPVQTLAIVIVWVSCFCCFLECSMKSLIAFLSPEPWLHSFKFLFSMKQ